MKRKLSKLDLQSILIFKFLDTPGDEIAPRSNEIGKYFENERFGHKASHVRSNFSRAVEPACNCELMMKTVCSPEYYCPTRA